MSLARQPEPQHEPPRRPELRLVPSDATVFEQESLESSPSRGIMWGVGISLVGFWIPAAALVTWLRWR